MAGSFSLAAYRALTRRKDARPPVYEETRPAGELLWIHCAENDAYLAVLDLAQRQIASRPGLRILITSVGPLRNQDHDLPAAVTQCEICDDHPASVAAFLDHWSPDCCVWTWGGLRPNLIIATAQQGCALFLVNADTAGFDGRRDRWLPDVARNLLPLFAAVMVRAPAAARRLMQLGLAKDDIVVTSALQAGGQALECNESDLSDLSAACVGRAIWFANGVHKEELQTVLAAHRQALRLSHRLLLIIRPAGNLLPQDAMDEISKQNFRLLNWDDGNFPDETTQVLLSEDARDIGLFYRGPCLLPRWIACGGARGG
mgnify:CR=1 FL=1